MPVNIHREVGKSALEHRIIVGGMKGILAWGLLVKQRAKEHVPVDTGHLARGINVFEPTEEDLIFKIQVGVDLKEVPYARAHEYGSGLYAEEGERDFIRIEAGFWTGKSNKKALAFHWPEGPKPHPAYDEESDKYIFRAVKHPGVRPTPYLRPAKEASQEEGKYLFARAVIAEMAK